MGGPRLQAFIPLSAAVFSSFLVFWATTAKLSVLDPTRFFVAPTLAAVAFWVTLTAIMVLYPLRGALDLALEGLKRRVYLRLVPPAYFVLHIFVYGILLERLLVQVFGSSGAPPSSLVAFISYSYIYHPSNAWNALLTVTQQPSLAVTIPPYYSLAIGPFSVTVGFLITILVTASIYQLLWLRGGLRKVGESIAIPAVGVVGGASCCLSIPILLEYVSPALQAVALAPAGSLVLSVLYYALPIGVVVALKLAVDGLDTTCRELRVGDLLGDRQK